MGLKVLITGLLEKMKNWEGGRTVSSEQHKKGIEVRMYIEVCLSNTKKWSHSNTDFKHLSICFIISL